MKSYYYFNFNFINNPRKTDLSAPNILPAGFGLPLIMVPQKMKVCTIQAISLLRYHNVKI